MCFKIVISDYPDVLGRKLEYEKELLHSLLNEVEIVVYPYTGRDEFIKVMQETDGLLTAFIPLDRETLAQCKRLKGISVNATGYNFIDLKAAKESGIIVSAIGEYCTNEVADHTMALILALSRNLKPYIHEIDQLKQWKYYLPGCPKHLTGQTLGIFGLGKIGRAVAKRATGFGFNVIACDPNVSSEQGQAVGVRMTGADSVFRQSDIISNHMNQTNENVGLFNYSAFCKMKKKPIFINVSRGESMVERDLIKALDEGLLRGAGLDVLEEEKPDLSACGLLGRENVIVTPHAAFYSEKSIRDLQRISCENLAYSLRNEKERIFKIVS